MAVASPIIAAGAPGEVWRNETDKIVWQFICSLSNSCGQCVQFHLQVGRYWPIPLHRGCRCSQEPVPVGESARPFVDFREVIREASPDQRAKFVGKANLTLIESGAVKWSDVVTPARIRTLHEVVGKQKLTVADLRKGGLSQARASLAYASAHPEEESTARRSAKALAGFLEAQGVSRETVKKAVAASLASRAGVKGPSGSKAVAVPLPPLPPLKMLRPVSVAVAIAQITGLRVADLPIDARVPDPIVRRMLVVSVGPSGSEFAIPRDREEFNRIVEANGGAFDYDAALEMIRRTGVRP